MLKVKFESIVNGIVEEIDGYENVGPVTISDQTRGQKNLAKANLINITEKSG